MTGPARSHTDAVAELGLALGRYGQRAAEAVSLSGRSAAAVSDRVGTEVSSRRARLEAAEQALARCLQSKEARCGTEQRQVEEARRRYQAALQAQQICAQALARLQPAQRRFAGEVAARVGEGQSLTAEMGGRLEQYLRPSAAVGAAGGTSSSGGSALSGGSVGGATVPPTAAPRVVPGLPPDFALVPLAMIDTSDSGVHGPADFGKGYSPADLAWSFDAFEREVLPALAAGRGADEFAARDGAEGRMGCRSLSDSFRGFLGTDAIKLEPRSDGRYEVANGYHRIWVAQRTGRDWVPARIR